MAGYYISAARFHEYGLAVQQLVSLTHKIVLSIQNRGRPVLEVTAE